jgi:diguanylate cyclase (GGDEF)-like protein
VDASLISAVLLGFMVAGRGIVATNSQVTFLVYFLLMALIARRYDVRLAVFGAIVILSEYLMVILIGYSSFAIPSISPDSVYGSFNWLNQVGRALILGFSALIMINTVINARRLREQSIRDPMLGIFNRRYFEEVLALEFKYSRELDKPLTVVMMDLDHFKAYNDRHGHLKGDKVLVAVADFLLRNLRRNDVLARFGGDEFVFLLLETPPEGAGVMLMRLQDQMRRWLEGVLEIQEPATSFSFGVAGLSAADTQPSQLIARADQHLYRAKAAGGGVICDEQGRIVPREEVVEET